MMLGTVRPTRHRSAARVSRGWLMRGARRKRDGCQLDGIHSLSAKTWVNGGLPHNHHKPRLAGYELGGSE
jgi:hypothetical protein